jgi:Leucine-rich repeat (LRR) protein
MADGGPSGTMALVGNVSNHFVTILPVWLEPTLGDDADCGFVLPVPREGRAVLLMVDSGGATSVSSRQGHALCRWLAARMLGPRATSAAAALDAARPAEASVVFERLGLTHHRLLNLLPTVGGGNVQSLALNHNRLVQAPAALFHAYPRLTSLFLNDNQLTELPAELGALVSLRELRLDRNRLRVLPPEIGALVSLQVLHVPNNRLATLPRALSQLASLREVLFLGNPLADGLPPELDHYDPGVGVWQAPT